MSHYKAVLFDLDGTLIDTNELIIQTFQTVLDEKFPGKYSRESILPFLGPPLYETFTQVDPTKVDDLIAAYRKWNVENHDSMVQAFPGVVDTVKELHARGIQLAIVSTKRNEMIERALNLMAIREYFSAVIGLDDVKNAKPDPEPVQLALSKLNVAPEVALMVGDNFHDIMAGRAAGVDSVAVAWSIKGLDYLLAFEPKFTLHSMDELLTIVDGEDK
ncbi:pyrophosphatase PpaX [Chryseomicrobium aureum]|uniref:pyrophosphatase PpaX n=1 Tax=Chryseomicrobium aureum TaxID=1441723 RepID=UPI00195BB486|nr:pyrophosphatase PpaX [Chryseomicrobium aureum]MBM7707234.1 pyrophosphatase PpaX [Chryseomicrobium aureum]